MRLLLAVLLFAACLSHPCQARPGEDAQVSILHNSSVQVEKASLTRIESISRRAAVKVITSSGYGSGTYVAIGRMRAVFTAAHVVRDIEWVRISYDGKLAEARVVYRDHENDFAVLTSETIQDKTPVRLRPYDGDISGLIGERINYSGYPNRHALLTIRGSIAGIDDGCIILQSYAWMGSSGSGVFDELGRFIGIVTGVDLGSFRDSLSVVESIVWITPLRNIDMEKVKESLRDAQ